jgi:outer membrane beta-barrel protein
METGFRILFLAPQCKRSLLAALLCAAALNLAGCGLFGGNKPAPLGSEAEEADSAKAEQEANEQPVIDPEVTRRTLKTKRIDTENIEFGVSGGLISIEDFGTNAVTGGRLAYHITEDLFLELNGGYSQAGTTSFERLSGGPRLLSDDERRYYYVMQNVGWNFLPGEVFIGRNRAYGSALYVTVGAGVTRFADDDNFTASVGFGYRVLLTDWFAAHLDVRDYLFDSDLLGQNKVLNNLEGSLGLSVFF